MGIYIDIKRLQISVESAEYSFITTDGRCGRFLLNRSSGETELLEPAPNDSDGRLYARAAHKVKVAWREGIVLEKAVWAS